MKILLVDDDKLVLTSISKKLIENGYEVYAAENGTEAIELVQEKSIDLIISDIMMPNLSGITLVNILKQMNKRNIPVILISSLDQANLIIKSLNVEVNDIMVKPIDFNAFLSKISNLKTLLCCYRNLVMLKN
jgi:DNA-binding response OmpR family regulator